MKEYALYKGDELLSIGTIQEIAKEQNIKEKTVKFYKTRAYEKRIQSRKNKNSKILIEIEREEE